MYVWVDQGAIQRLFREKVPPFILNVGNRVVARAQANCNVDTGRLRSSISARIGELASLGVGCQVGSNVSYAVYVHEGTRPHIIEPRPPRKFLKFQGRDGTVFARRVHHPGYRGNPFLSDALRSEMRSLRRSSRR